MKLFEIRKNYKEKIIKFAGIELKFPRKKYRRERRIIGKNVCLSDDGYSLRAYFSRNDGESQVAKDVKSALEKCGISFDVSDYDFLERAPKYRKLINFSTGNVIRHPEYENISLLVWEFESGMLEARPYLFDGVDKVLVFSSFCYTYFKKLVPNNVRLVKLTYPFNFKDRPDEDAKVTKAKYGLNPEDFVVFFNFSYSSSYFRKNPEAVLEVFANSLKDKPNAKLFIKTHYNSGTLHERFLNKIKAFGLEEKTVLECGNLSRREVVNLIGMSDVYLSLHRGEGIGLGMLEAMSMGKTVVATNYGGNADFVKEGIAFPVPYSLIVPQELDKKEYAYVKEWAEADKAEAERILRYLYDNPRVIEETGKKAAAFVAEMFTPEKFVSELTEKV